MSSIRDEIDEILVDCCDEYEQMSGWESAFSDGVEVPFAAALLGIAVTVHGFRASEANVLQCQVAREEKQRWIGIEDLDAEGLPEDCLHLLALYCAWIKGGGWEDGATQTEIGNHWMRNNNLTVTKM